MLTFWRLCALLCLALAAEGKAKMKATDPHRVFCGNTLCYDVLEVTQEATEEEIKKSYRKLAREYHPDKNPEKSARAKFTKIAKAYEVVGNEESRKTYDFMMENPHEYFKKYGQYYYFVSAPKSNVLVVLALIVTIMTVAHFFMLQNQYQEHMKVLLKLCVENKGVKEGGSPETMDIHQRAKERYEAQLKEGSKKTRPQKVKSYKKDDGFRKVVEEIIRETDTGINAPTVFDTFLFAILKGGGKKEDEAKSD